MSASLDDVSAPFSDIENIPSQLKSTRPPRYQYKNASGIIEVGLELSTIFTREEAIKSAYQFLKAPTHGTASDVLFIVLGSTIICERTNLAEHRGEFFKRLPGTCYFEPFPTIRQTARTVLEFAIDRALLSLKPEIDGKEIKDLYIAAGKAKGKARTRDFIAGALELFSDSILVFPNIPWNETPEAIPTQTDVVDFSGPEPIARPARSGEYFRNPAPCTAIQIIEATEAPEFSRYMAGLFPDSDTLQAALSCLALCIAGKPLKTFQIWTNGEGDGGKNTLFDLIAQLVPGRCIMAKNALILYKGDSGERRFGEIRLQGRAAVFFDEVGGCFDIGQIKKYTGQSGFPVEAKGCDSIEIKPTWVLIALCNELPKFFPVNDSAFLSRIFVLPFGAVFYADEADKQRRVDQGVSLTRLKKAVDKVALISTLLAERPAILKCLITEWISVRDERGGKPYQAAECVKAREKYRQANDLAEQFFDEYLEHTPKASIPLVEVKNVWENFTGKRPSTKDLIEILSKRFPFIQKKTLHGEERLYGISLKPDTDLPVLNGSQTGAGNGLFPEVRHL